VDNKINEWKKTIMDGYKEKSTASIPDSVVDAAEYECQ